MTYNNFEVSEYLVVCERETNRGNKKSKNHSFGIRNAPRSCVISIKIDATTVCFGGFYITVSLRVRGVILSRYPFDFSGVVPHRVSYIVIYIYPKFIYQYNNSFGEPGAGCRGACMCIILCIVVVVVVHVLRR